MSRRSGEGWLESGDDLFHASDEVVIGPPIEPEGIAEGYAEGRRLLHLDLHLSGVDAEPKGYCAVFYRLAQSVFVIDSGPIWQALDLPEHPDHRRGGHRYWERTVFVDVVDEIENGEPVRSRCVPSLVWLKPVDLLDPSLMDTINVAATDGGLPLPLDESNGERAKAFIRFIPGDEHELPYEIVERASQIVRHVSEGQGEFDGGQLSPDLPPEVLPPTGVEVRIVNDAIRVTIKELAQHSVKVISVATSVVDLRSYWVKARGHGA